MCDTKTTRQPRRPPRLWLEARGSFRPEEGRGAIGAGESDSLVVPRKAGTAAGGKEATRGSAPPGNAGRPQRRQTRDHRRASHSVGRVRPRAERDRLALGPGRRILGRPLPTSKPMRRAVCVNSASTVLWGGAAARRPPTRQEEPPSPCP